MMRLAVVVRTVARQLANVEMTVMAMHSEVAARPLQQQHVNPSMVMAGNQDAWLDECACNPCALRLEA
eukprot:scaffold143264_cov31-Tisochrysis_lutea.AAC.5